EAYHQIKEKNLITVALYNGCTKIVKEWEEKNPSISIEIDQLIKQPYILPVMSQSNMKDFIKWAYSTQRAFNNEVIRNVFIALPSLNFEEDYSLLKLIANTVIPDFTSELKSNSKQYTDSLQESILIKLCLVSLIEDKHIGLIVSLIYECMIQKRQEIFTDILRSEYIKNEESWRLIRRLLYIDLSLCAQLLEIKPQLRELYAERILNVLSNASEQVGCLQTILELRIFIFNVKTIPIYIRSGYGSLIFTVKLEEERKKELQNAISEYFALPHINLSFVVIEILSYLSAFYTLDTEEIEKQRPEVLTSIRSEERR